MLDVCLAVDAWKLSPLVRHLYGQASKVQGGAAASRSVLARERQMEEGDLILCHPARAFCASVSARYSENVSSFYADTVTNYISWSMSFASIFPPLPD